MLTKLQIQNYALIQQIRLDFKKGLTTITGETGAGKSILLGGLSLVLGKRLQPGLLKNSDKKTVVEATFDISEYSLQDFFENLDLDYEPETIIRREISTSGKSRSFVNDTPVRLDVLQELTGKLIDIHSQHQTLALNDSNFQFDLLDATAGHTKLLNEYKNAFELYKNLKKQLEKYQNQLHTAEEELAYKSYQLKELEAVKLDDIDINELEQNLKKLDHIEEIKLVLSEADNKINEDENGLYQQIVDLKNSFQKIAIFSKEYEELAQRLESLHWELQDVGLEVSNLSEQTDFDPSEKEKLQSQYDQLQMLLLKHKVLEIKDLINLRNQLQNEVADLSGLKNKIVQTESNLNKIQENLNGLAIKIHKNRIEAAEKLVKQIENVLQKLSMQNTRLKIDVKQGENYLSNGKDDLQFLISSDKGKNFGSVKQVASGGELSRIMLAIKVILSRYKKLPTIIFDEIDSGVSGEVAQNMAEVLKYLSQNMQVIAITHLPQIAVAGDTHFKVYKTSEGAIETQVKLLNFDDRVCEIAEMLEGKPPSESALQHAKHLLDINQK